MATLPLVRSFTTLESTNMKEFNTWFTISFSFMGKSFERTISIKKAKENVENNIWYYYTDINVRGDVYDVEVFGTYDDDGNIRTTDECYVNGKEVCPAFGITIYNEGCLGSDEDIVGTIDDVEVIDND